MMHIVQTINYYVNSEDAVDNLLAEYCWAREVYQHTVHIVEGNNKYIVQFRFSKLFDISIIEDTNCSIGQYDCYCQAGHQDTPYD